MYVEHDGDRTILDTQGIAILLHRTPAAVRRYCARGERGYYTDEAETALARLPRPEVVTAAEAERDLGIAADRIYQWVCRGQIKPAEKGRPALYFVEELLRLKNREARKAQLDL